MMNLETLANELLLSIFEYLSVVHLFHTFDNLNTRFNTLLFTRFQKYHLNFRSISKRDFDIVCQRYLPLITNRILSLTLSDDNETPDQIKSFLSYGLNLRQLTHLRSVRLYHLRSTMLMQILLTEFHQLPFLTHLDLIDCSFENEHQSISDQLNDLWSVSKLNYCHLDIHFNRQIYIIHPSVVSTSLRSLSIQSYRYGPKELNHLLQNTPRLQHLCISIRDDPEDQPLPLTISSLIKLKLSVYESPLAMTHLLKHTPNLRHLTIETDEINMNGHDWERIITDDLPQLKIFHLKMIFRLNDHDNKDQRVDDLLDSFRTQFWLIERQWYVRCDWNRCEQCEKNNIYLYTLPYAFNSYFIHEATFKTKSTRYTDNDDSSYDHVHTLGYALIHPSNSALSFFRFVNLHHLELYLPFVENFFTMFPNFDQLISMQVAPYSAAADLDYQGQLQTLLDRAPRLNSLTLKSRFLLSDLMPPYKYSNKSFRQLHLPNINQWYNTAQCTRLSCSSIGSQCEVLSITVENRRNILDLIHIMPNLRALHVICRDDTWMMNNNNSSLLPTDELIDWLRMHLPPTCAIVRHDESVMDRQRISFKAIRLWIR
ncbi:unnamed protein product [Adineta steineri]|uniref:F-box domain-containing protein n=1 Tax=Adineta steineri TaxID=433720 RepID=A0A819R533_9BILA|nr:unnamed protein product [Adineta steineri]CAF4042144.1 unnamed protein product [Adineta steineri]